MAVAFSNDKKMSQCCTCGTTWQTGRDGTHSCSAKLKTDLNVANEMIAKQDKLLRNFLPYVAYDQYGGQVLVGGTFEYNESDDPVALELLAHYYNEDGTEKDNG